MSGRPAKTATLPKIKSKTAKQQKATTQAKAKIATPAPVVTPPPAKSNPQADYIKSLQETADPKDLINGGVNLSGQLESETKPEKTLQEEAADLMAQKLQNIVLKATPTWEQQKELIETLNASNGGTVTEYTESKQPNMSAILAKYEEKCNHPSDINQLLPYLRAVSEVCGHITEFGVRNPTSTYAFLAGNPKQLVSYDIERTPGIAEVESIAPNFKFVLGSTLEVEIEETDFLFIDTHHTYKQLSQELYLHAGKVRKYMGFHDITTFGFKDESEYSEQPKEVYGSGPGLWAAITPFLQHTPEWTIDFQSSENNGLLILRRIN